MPRSISVPPAEEPVVEPGPKALTLVEFVTLVRAVSQMDAPTALAILNGTHEDPEINLLGEMLMLADTKIARDNVVVIEGLQTMVDKELITDEARQAIIAAWPMEG